MKNEPRRQSELFAEPLAAIYALNRMGFIYIPPTTNCLLLSWTFFIQSRRLISVKTCPLDDKERIKFTRNT